MHIVKDKNQEIIVVAGQGRCGTSLVMRMLQTAGIELYYTQENSFETEEMMELAAGKSAWLDGVEGKAVKILLPVLNKLPNGRQYRIIYLTRNKEQQAKSMIKMMDSILGRHGHNTKLKNVKNGITRDDIASIQYLQSVSKDVVVMSFEELIADPLRASTRLSAFLMKSLPVEQMAGVVIKRSTKNYPGFLEETKQFTKQN